MSLPHVPVVQDYGELACGDAHHIWMYPAVLRQKGVLSAEVMIEEGQSGCYFHPNRPAVAICSVSGRMICDLCTTEWEGETVSFEALQTILKKDSGKGANKGKIKWDDVALSLAILPILLWFITIVTAPIALGICLLQWRKGATGVVRKSRWRYLVAGILSALQIGFWLWLLFAQI